jgi:hypothetical protein
MVRAMTQPPPGWGPTQPQPIIVYAQPRPTNGYGLWSCIFGIWGMLVIPTVWFFGIGLLGAWTSVLAVILGHIGWRLQKARGGVGQGSSAAGLATGYVGLANAVAGLIFVMSVAADS